MVVMSGHQYSNLTIPCRPTSPDINLTLSFNGETVSLFIYLFYYFYHYNIYFFNENIILKKEINDY